MMKIKALFLMAGALALTSCDFEFSFGFGTNSGSEIASNSASSSSETNDSSDSLTTEPMYLFGLSYDKELDLGELGTISVDLDPSELDEPISVTFDDPLSVRYTFSEYNAVTFYPVKEGSLLFTVMVNGKTSTGTIEVEDVPSGYTLTHVGGVAHTFESLPIEFRGPYGDVIPASMSEFRLISGSSEPSRLSVGDYYFETPGVYSFGLAAVGAKECSNIITLNVAPNGEWTSLVFEAFLGDGTPLQMNEPEVHIGDEVSFALSYTDGSAFYGEWTLETVFLPGDNFEKFSDHGYRATAVGTAAFMPVVTSEGEMEYYIDPSFVAITVSDPDGGTPYGLEIRGPIDRSAVFFNDMSGDYADTGIDLVSDVDHPSVEPTADLAIVSTEKGPGIEFRFEKDTAADNVYSVYAKLNYPGSFPVYFFWGNAASELVYFHAYDPDEGLFLLSSVTSEAAVGEEVELSYSVDGFNSGYQLEFSVGGPGSYSISSESFVGYAEGTYVIQASLAGSSVYATGKLRIAVSSEKPLDPYENVDKDEFYASYEPASDAEDAYYRSLHGLMSGSLEVPGPEPIRDPLAPMDGGLYVKNTSASYVEGGQGYVVYDARGNEQFTVYEEGAYITLEEVAAYIQAFGQVPANYYPDRYGYPDPDETIWGEYFRLNDSYFSGDTDRYPYEPLLPDISGEGGLTDYYEVDIGTTGTYTGPSYPVRIYNDGHTITRGGARIVYAKTRLGSDISASDRHLFYTYNHYNDFQEYLNYYQGWGQIFGNVTAGGEIDEVAPGGPTPYVDVVLQDLY